MTIDDTMKQPLNSQFEVDKGDPIYEWLKEHNKFGDNLNLIEILKEMPRDMAKEVLRRMITAQAIPNLDSKTLKKLTKLAFTKRE